METYNITGVEIFSSGVWNGDEYSLEDLQGMVAAFEKNKVAVRPFLKLGHDDDQKLIQNDGLPAAGWIDRLYILGEKLVADFSSIPKKIFDLISNKAYRKVSSEIYWNVKIGEEYYKHMLGAVALLGADTPAVMNLNDILGLYTKVNSEDKRSYEINVAFKKETTVEELEQIKKDYAKTQEDLKSNQSELEALRLQKEELEKKNLELITESNKARMDKFTTDLVNKKLASPAMKPFIEAILDVDKKEYSFKDMVFTGIEGDKSLSKEEVIEEMLKLFKAASEVNFCESSLVGVENKVDSDKETDEKIKQYALDHKITYGQAAKAVLSQQK
jgi:phage host-nuclease inhibitor protein Gam